MHITVYTLCFAHKLLNKLCIYVVDSLCIYLFISLICIYFIYFYSERSGEKIKVNNTKYKTYIEITCVCVLSLLLFYYDNSFRLLFLFFQHDSLFNMIYLYVQIETNLMDIRFNSRFRCRVVSNCLYLIVVYL
jgi:hypothetical protein